MAFKKYPQPPFKKFVKTEGGKILETEKHRLSIQPAVYNKNGYPLVRFGWEIGYGGTIFDKDGKAVGLIDFVDKIAATADTKEDLL